MIPRRALWRRLLVVGLVILSLALLSVFFREQAGGALHGVQDGGARVLAPLQAGASRIVEPFRDAWNWFGDLFQAKGENARLRREVAALRQTAAENSTLRDENVHLRELLQLKDDAIYDVDGVETVPARVIAASGDAWYSSVTINAGRLDGLGIYDPVVNERGLVGRVSQLTASTAQVTLLIDQDSYVDALITPGEVRGLVAGSVRGNLSMLYVDKAEKIKVGQAIVTSGKNGSAFIKGIPIGIVENVGRQDVDLYQNVSVRPLVDFGKLDYVQVVVRR